MKSGMRWETTDEELWQLSLPVLSEFHSLVAAQPLMVFPQSIIARIYRCTNRCSAQVSVLRMNAAGREESTSKKSDVLKSNCLAVNSKQETAIEIHEACEEFDSRNLPPDPMASYSGPQTPSGLLKRIRQPRGNTFSSVSWNACIFWSTRTFPVSKSEFLEMPMNDRFLYSGQSNPLANQ